MGEKLWSLWSVLEEQFCSNSKSFYTTPHSYPFQSSFIWNSLTLQIRKQLCLKWSATCTQTSGHHDFHSLLMTSQLCLKWSANCMQTLEDHSLHSRASTHSYKNNNKKYLSSYLKKRLLNLWFFSNLSGL